MIDADLFSRLVSMAGRMGITLSEPASGILVKFIEKIVEWNVKTHLVSRKNSGSGEVLKQVVDSLSLLRLGIEPDINVMDVGSGIGLPGMVMAIARPDLMVRLVDSGERVCVLARRMKDLMDLHNVEVIHARFPGGVTGLAGNTDLFVSKAFLSPEKWLAAIDIIAPPSARAVVMTASVQVKIPDNMCIIKDDRFTLPGTDMPRRNIMVGRSSEST